MYLNKRAVVVGAGPSGALAAINLAKHGLKVDVYERAEAHAQGSAKMSIGPRSYNILLSKRSVTALEEGGVPLPEGSYVLSTKTARYAPNKKPMFVPQNSAYSKAVNRGILAGHLVTQALAQYPDKITVQFGTMLQDLSLKDQQAVFAKADGTQLPPVNYDILIAADGQRSRTREFFSQQVPGFTFTQEEDEMEFKSLEVGSLEHVDPDYLQHFAVMNDTSRGVTLLCTASPDGVLTGPWVAPKGFHGSHETQEDYINALKTSFPHFKEEDYPAMAAQLAGAPVSNGGMNIYCSQLHGPGAILMGDAGHGMWPSLGQGANCALESAGVLEKVLQDCKGDLSAVPERYNAVRHEDALAAVTLTARGFGGKNVRSMVNKLFMAKLVGRMMLNKVLPWLVQKPALTTMNSTLTRYSEIMKASERQAMADNLALATLAVAIIAAVAWKLLAL